MSLADLRKLLDDAGVRVLGELAHDLGWRPGYLVGCSFINPQLATVRAAGASISPCGRYAVVEVPR